MMKPDLVLIATSTGGPSMLKSVLPGLDENLGVPVIVVQHMLDGYTEKLASSLNEISKISIKETTEYEKLEKSQVYVAKAGVHVKLSSLSDSPFPRITFSDEPKVNFVKPAADVLFKNVATNYKRKNILVVIGTGMGKDGLEGIKELRKTCNVYCIVEDRQDCAVYGMPKEVYEAGLSNEVVRVSNISDKINKICKKGWS